MSCSWYLRSRFCKGRTLVPLDRAYVPAARANKSPHERASTMHSALHRDPRLAAPEAVGRAAAAGQSTPRCFGDFVLTCRERTRPSSRFDLLRLPSRPTGIALAGVSRKGEPRTRRNGSGPRSNAFLGPKQSKHSSPASTPLAIEVAVRAGPPAVRKARLAPCLVLVNSLSLACLGVLCLCVLCLFPSPHPRRSFCPLVQRSRTKRRHPAAASRCSTRPSSPSQHSRCKACTPLSTARRTKEVSTHRRTTAASTSGTLPTEQPPSSRPQPPPTPFRPLRRLLPPPRLQGRRPLPRARRPARRASSAAGRRPARSSLRRRPSRRRARRRTLRRA